jgi:hypothetical protein
MDRDGPVQRNRLPMLTRAKQIEVVSQRDEKTNSWKRVDGTGFIAGAVNLFQI